MTRTSIGFITAVLPALVIGAPPLVRPSVAVEPPSYRVDFVASPASGNALNDEGLVVGVQQTLPPGCTPHTCAPVPQAVLWFGDDVVPLPGLAGYSTVTSVGINSSGWVAGYAGDPTSTGARALVWKPAGTGHEIIDLGVLPGTTSSWAFGIDDLGRVVGWSTTGTIPTHAAPFVWTEATGLADLSSQGFPAEFPLAVSPNGTVATSGHWYLLDDPGSVTALAPPPPHFSGPGNYPAAINDAGEQVRFQISTGAEFLPYLFRYQQTGTWQQLWFLPAGHLAPYGIGSITSEGDITATVGGVGLVAYGPNALAQPLAGKLSAAYGGHDVTKAGPIGGQGSILAQVMIGRSQRLVMLVPAEQCTGNCMHVGSISMTGRFINDLRDPGQCTERARNLVLARLTVLDAAERPVSGAVVHARFLDDYYLNSRVTDTTNRDGIATFVHRGPACVGAIALLVDDVTGTQNTLDFNVGELTDYVIPLP